MPKPTRAQELFELSVELHEAALRGDKGFEERAVASFSEIEQTGSPFESSVEEMARQRRGGVITTTKGHHLSMLSEAGVDIDEALGWLGWGALSEAVNDPDDFLLSREDLGNLYRHVYGSVIWGTVEPAVSIEIVTKEASSFQQRIYEKSAGQQTCQDLTTTLGEYVKFALDVCITLGIADIVREHWLDTVYEHIVQASEDNPGEHWTKIELNLRDLSIDSRFWNLLQDEVFDERWDLLRPAFQVAETRVGDMFSTQPTSSRYQGI